MNFQIRRQCREEARRESRNALVRRLCSASRELRGAGRASSLVWELKRGTGRLCKPLRSSKKAD